MDRPLISVLIPAYNAEKYIEHCLKSVCGQTYDNLEIIVINDGSTDRTGEIADKIAEKDDRIDVIHQENAGVATTRNRLIERSRGEYILQVDADDYIDKNTVEILLECAEKADADMAVCTHEEGDEQNFSFPDNDNSGMEILSGEKRFEKLFGSNKLDFIVPWGKIYNRKIFTGLKYPDGKIHEDEYLAHILMDRSERIVFLDRTLFYYRVERKGITKSYFSLKRLDCVPALLKRNRFFEEKGSYDNLKLCYFDFLKRFQYFYYGIKYHYPDRKDTAKDLYEEYADVYNKAAAKGMLGIKERLMFGIFIIAPGFNYALRGLLGKKSIVT